MYTVAQIREIASKYQGDEYAYIGIRTQEMPFELGQIRHESLVWVDGDMTEEGTGGISVTSIDEPQVVMHSSEASCFTGEYFGSHQAIIGSNNAAWGEDAGELIMQDSVVLEVLS